MPDQRERIAVVTGGGSGIGAAVGQALADEGWKVVLAGRRLPTLEAVAATRPGRLDPITADVTDEASVRQLFDRVVDRHGRVDLLFNNAGKGAPAVDIDDHDLATWNAVVAVNLTDAFLCTREAFRIMRHQTPQGGRIINNGIGSPDRQPSLRDDVYRPTRRGRRPSPTPRPSTPSPG